MPEIEKNGGNEETAGEAMMDDETMEFAVGLFSALAHPTRLRIIEMLTQQERTVNEVAEVLGLLQPNASQHLAVLSRAGVVKSRREGASRCYTLRGPRIAQIMRLVNEFRAIHAAVLREIAGAKQEDDVDK